MAIPRQTRSSGGAFLACEVAFLTTARAAGQPALSGMGSARLAPGLAFPADGRQRQ